MLRLIMAISVLFYATIAYGGFLFTPSVFDIVPLNSPVKEPIAKFLLKTPQNFSIDKIKYIILGPKEVSIKGKREILVGTVKGPQGPELQINVEKLSAGLYKLFVVVLDKKKKEHRFSRAHRDFTPFIIEPKVVGVPEPDPKVNNATLLGVDVDNNGIRDDIQIYINNTYKDPEVNKAFQQYAVSWQNIFRNLNDKTLTNQASHESGRSHFCVLGVLRSKGFDSKMLAIETKKFETFFNNTKSRILANLKADEYFHGESGTVLSKEEACLF